jgi:hypothetical protein
MKGFTTIPLQKEAPKTAGCGHRQPRDLGDNGAKPAMPQTLLETFQHLLAILRW